MTRNELLNSMVWDQIFEEMAWRKLMLTISYDGILTIRNIEGDTHTWVDWHDQSLDVYAKVVTKFKEY